MLVNKCEIYTESGPLTISEDEGCIDLQMTTHYYADRWIEFPKIPMSYLKKANEYGHTSKRYPFGRHFELNKEYYGLNKYTDVMIIGSKYYILKRKKTETLAILYVHPSEVDSFTKDLNKAMKSVIE